MGGKPWWRQGIIPKQPLCKLMDTTCRFEICLKNNNNYSYWLREIYEDCEERKYE